MTEPSVFATIMPSNRDASSARSALLLLTCLTACILPAISDAQDQSQLSGVVTDNTATPVHRARIMVLSSDLSDTLAVAFTDDQGRYDKSFVTNVGIENEQQQRIEDHAIVSLYPNPTNGPDNEINIGYIAPSENQRVPAIILYDVLGRLVDYSTSVATGVYFVRLQFDLDTPTAPRSLVVSTPGSIRFSMKREYVDVRPSAKTTAAVENQRAVDATVGKGVGHKSPRQTDTQIRVEKDGYIFQEITRDLTPSTPTVADFQLDAAAAPTAAFSISGNLDARMPTLFDASASQGANQEALTYVWTFGDSFMGTGKKIAHVYTAGATFDVTLTVTGAHGARAEVTQQVTIEPPPAPVSSDGRLTATIRGVDGVALPDVNVTVAGTQLTGVTSFTGGLLMEGVDVGAALSVQLQKSGFASQVIRVGVPADTSTTLYFEATMRERDASKEIVDAENGFSTSARDGVRVSVPVDALLMPDGSPATGTISLAMTPVNVADSAEVASFPGRFEGIEPDGETTPLLSFGTAEYSFEQNGIPLQLAPGKTADIEIPIYTSGAAVGDTIPAWSMNEDLGTWIQEGVGIVRESAASPSGLVLAVEVGHFSWWNCDIGPDRNDGDGLCYKWNCTGGQCHKEKVYCWVDGARREQANSKNDLTPPVFNVREFWPVAGASFILPGNETITLRATHISGGALLRADTTFFAEAFGTSSIELTLDTVAISDNRTLPIRESGELEPNGVAGFSFAGNSGQVIGIEGSSPIGFSIGTVALYNAAGTQLLSESLLNKAKLVVLPADGDYSILVTSTRLATVPYRLRVYRPSDTLEMNTNTSVDLSDGDFQIFQFNNTPGSVINAAVESPKPASNQIFEAIATIEIWNSNLTKTIKTGGRDSETGDFETDDAFHYLLFDPREDATGPFQLGLSEVDAADATPLAFDAVGGVDHPDELTLHGSRRFFEFPLDENDGVEFSVHPLGSDLPLEAAGFKIIDPNENQLSFIPTAGRPGESLAGHAFRAHATGTYQLIVDDNRYAKRGDFELKIRKVGLAAVVVVDDDLACAGASTTSLTAALYGIADGGTVTLCDGIYSSPSRPTISRDGITLEGESQAGVRVSYYDEFRTPGAVLDVTGTGVTVRNMTIEAEQIGTKQNGGIRSVVTIAGNTAVFEDLTIRPLEEGTTMGPAINGQYKEITIRNLTYTHGSGIGAQSLNIKASDSVVIENSSVDYPATINMTLPKTGSVSINGLQMIEFNLSVSSAAVVEIENSTITGNVSIARVGDVMIRNNVFPAEPTPASRALSISATDNILIEENDFDRRIEISVSENQVATIQRNHFSPERDGLSLELASAGVTGGGTFNVLNNLIDAKVHSNGNIRIFSPERMTQMVIANNTLVYGEIINSPSVPSIRASLSNQSFTGDLPIVVVNNIFKGSTSTVFDLPANTTIDSDYNIFQNYTTIFDGGGTRTGGSELTSDARLAGDGYQLLSDSPALDSGASTAQYPGIPAVDYLGVVRPQGGGWDRGAFEGFVTGKIGATLRK